MICKQCADTGQKSRVFPGPATTTLLGWQPYYDEDGRLHNHDPNVTTTYYRCSNGHTWEEKTQRHCWCQEETANRG